MVTASDKGQNAKCIMLQDNILARHACAAIYLEY